MDPLMLSARKISLKNYSVLSIPVPNPVNITSLPRGKSFQITNQNFLLQFSFSGRNLSGFIIKRNKDKGIRLRWCMFRNCEHSPYDYTVTIAEPNSPPFESNFFTISFPPGLQYEFQGLEFFSPQ
jgi:hypothetical protein